MTREDIAAKWVNFDKSDWFHTSALESQGESTDPAEQIKDAPDHDMRLRSPSGLHVAAAMKSTMAAGRLRKCIRTMALRQPHTTASTANGISSPHAKPMKNRFMKSLPGPSHAQRLN
ncbi:MAG TPA: hypothetical protein VNU68_35380 [Verrucomicrobiae bacterium]|nr:hypothetical protein [Verrucomicrobiae bacterium]